MDESQKEWDTEHILGGSIYMTLPNRWNQYTVGKTQNRGEGLPEVEDEGNFWGDVNVLQLNRGLGYTGVTYLSKLSKYTVKICVVHCIFYLKIQKINKYLGESLLMRTALFRGNCTDVCNNFEMHQKNKLMDRGKAHEQMMKYSKILIIEVVSLQVFTVKFFKLLNV